MKSPLASLLWRSLRVYQVFGANTDVGKTIFTTLLARSAKASWKENVTFLKPISTGPADEADHRYMEYDRSNRAHINHFAPGVKQDVLVEYDIPVSPHTAARVSGKTIPDDDTILARCREFSAACATKGNGWLFLETAGGVHSPGPSGNTQADIYIPLRVPVILVGDSRLGGISQTISAFESLRIRGYDVESVLLFQDDQYENHTYLEQYFSENFGIPVSNAPSPPAQSEDKENDAVAMKEYYRRQDCENVATDVLTHLEKRHNERIASIESLASKAHQHIWYPFTQQSLVGVKDITTIDSAHGDYFQTLRSSDDCQDGDTVLGSSFDGSASWWTQGLGHSNPQLTLAAAYAAGRYGHVMFAGSIHEPAMALASELLDGMRNPRLNRVFYSDNGSTGTEVAVKMGLRAARLRYGWGAEQRIGILGLKGGYHGDTLGAMDMSAPGAFNQKIEWYEGKGHWFDYPTVLCKNGEWVIGSSDEMAANIGQDRTYDSLGAIFDLEKREDQGEHHQYEEYITKSLAELQKKGLKFGSLIIEPIVLGAGGMNLVDPLFQRTLVNLVRKSPHLFTTTTAPPPKSSKGWSGLPVIFDEVFTGLYRLGLFTPSAFLGVHPDITVHAKLLTGGLIPLCTTLASEDIFNSFNSPDKTDALLHGHSYTAHPIGCQVALVSLREMQTMERRGDWDWAKSQGWDTKPEVTRREDVKVWSIWPRQSIEELSRRTDRVEGVWALGSVLAIHLKDASGAGYTSNAAQGLKDALRQWRDGVGGSWNVQSRVLGSVLYVMASQKTTEKSIRQIMELLLQSLT